MSDQDSVQEDRCPTAVNNPSNAIDEKHCGKSDIDVSSSLGMSPIEDAVLRTERDIATRVISVEDDLSLNPWTFRAFFLGLGFSAFSATLAQIYYFKPQTVYVSTIFLGILSYVLGLAMESIIPRYGLFRYLNPHPFNKKENAFIIIMVNGAAHAALATEILAVQRLYYNITPDVATSILLLISSQLIGYGIGGALRTVLLYPSKMLYPTILPFVSMINAFHHDGVNSRRRLKVFYAVFGVIFIWELFPVWIFPLLTGFSIICLAAPKNADVTRIFGGSNGNEGLGLLSICLDWQYITGYTNPMTIPLQAQFSGFIGYLLCIVVFVFVYYNNIWESRNFPFLSQALYSANGTWYNQTLILNDNFEVDSALLAEQGLPYFAGSWVVSLIANNLGTAATFSHLFLWNRDDLCGAWKWMAPSSLRKSWQKNSTNWMFWRGDGMREQPNLKEDEDIDPHYAQMLKYPDAPNSWYYALFIFSFAVALAVIYKAKSTLPWWALVISVLLAYVSTMLCGALYGLTGYYIPFYTFAQMVGGYMLPGRPMASMYFVLFSFNTATQATELLCDLKIAQYAKLPPRASFTAQIIGTVVGAILNYVIMNSVIDNQRDLLLSIQGTNVWSGQLVQNSNSQAIVWGGLAHELFTAGKRYQWVSWSYLVGIVMPVPFWLIHRRWPKLRANYLYIPIVCWNIGVLASGITSRILVTFLISFISQWWIRTRRPRWFQEYNYLVGAALDGGTQVMAFILTFSVLGAAGHTYVFPSWWGAKQNENYDRCMRLT